MTLIDFPKAKEAWTKPMTLEDWPWDKELGKPYGDINGSEPVEAVSPAAVVLAEAVGLLEGERAAQHGDKVSLHRTMAGLFSAYLGCPIKPSEAAMLECLMKAARTKHGLLNKDDFRDGAAYFGIAWECADAGC
jgi:hypothetical protein